MEDISESFQEVLRGTKDRAAIVFDIIKFLESENKFTSVESIIDNVDAHSEGFIKQAINLLLNNEFLVSQENARVKKVMLSGTNPESFIKETYGEQNKTPNEVLEHFEKYGFIELVNSVSKQVNHENTIVKEYDFDRLMLGRYVDFLLKAQEYLSWFKADQATARHKLKQIKRQSKTNK